MFPAFAYLSAYDRHKKLINDYLLLKGGSIQSLKRDTSRDKTDIDVIRENHRFLWDEESEISDTWGTRLAKKYYDKLFKEYCICDLTHYKHNKVALRWRTEKEVVIGKGQFQCGNKRCDENTELRSWEVNFGYIEHGEKKNALVKLRLCSNCSFKLNYRSQKHEVKKNKSLKRLGVTPTPSSEIPSSSKSIDVDNTTLDTEITVKTEDTLDQSNPDENSIWKEKPAENLDKSREDEFEEYLADLFM